MGFSIVGTGSAKASKILKNSDLEKIMDTSDKWIREKSGIQERRILKNETLLDLCIKSAENALEMSGILVEQLDLIICATVTSDYITPSMACAVQKELGATCPAFDVNAGCSGFIYAIDIAAGYFARNEDSTILVIGADAISRIVDWNDRSTAVLFGDGAGACILAKGDGVIATEISAKGNTDWLVADFISKKLKMKGQKVFQFAVSTIIKDIKEILKKTGISTEEVDYIMLHQANMRIIDAAVSRLGIPEEKFLKNLQYTGNTSAASIPLLLDENCRNGKLCEGDIVVLSAFGAGLTSGIAMLKWSIKKMI